MYLWIRTDLSVAICDICNYRILCREMNCDVCGILLFVRTDDSYVRLLLTMVLWCIDCIQHANVCCVEL